MEAWWIGDVQPRFGAGKTMSDRIEFKLQLTCINLNAHLILTQALRSERQQIRAQSYPSIQASLTVIRDFEEMVSQCVNIDLHVKFVKTAD